MKRKETEGMLMLKLMMKMKEILNTNGIYRRKERDRLSDRLSDLPDCVLLHVMKFMDIKHAVQTCVLSKRWKDLWKHLTSLALKSSDFRTVANFQKFVFQVLSGRDDSIALLNLHFVDFHDIDPTLLNSVLQYAALHTVQQLSINIHLNIRNFELCPLIFSCRSLTSLKLKISFSSVTIIDLPKSLHLPALKTLHLVGFTFTTSDNNCAEPFSTCKMLNTLVLEGCCLRDDARVLSMSNSKLSSLTINNYYSLRPTYEIALSTPNLSFLTILNCPNILLSSVCNLSFLEEVYINAVFPTLWKTDSLYNWLRVLANVKIMTVSSHILKIILKDLSNPGSMGTRPQPPCFVRLDLLKVKVKAYGRISDDEVNRVVEYLLRNSLLARVDVINC